MMNDCLRWAIDQGEKIVSGNVPLLVKLDEGEFRENYAHVKRDRTVSSRG